MKKKSLCGTGKMIRQHRPKLFSASERKRLNMIELLSRLFISFSLPLALASCSLFAFFLIFVFISWLVCVIQIGITCFTDLVYFGLLTSLPLLIIAVWLFIIFGAGLPFRSIFFFNDLYSHLDNQLHVNRLVEQQKFNKFHLKKWRKQIA